MSSLKEDIEEFTGMPCEEFVKCVESGKTAKENAWDYFASEEYAKLLFYQAMQKQNEPAMPQVLTNLIESYFTQPRILDYGCGTGMRALALYAMNCRDITLADVPNKYFSFLKFISEKYMLNLKFVELKPENMYPLNSCDVIIFDIERVIEPEIALLHLCQHLAPLGYLATNFKGETWLEGIELKRKQMLDLNSSIDRKALEENWATFQKV